MLSESAKLRNACSSWTGRSLIAIAVFLAQVLFGFGLIPIAISAFILIGILFIIENNPVGLKRAFVIAFLVLCSSLYIVLSWQQRPMPKLAITAFGPVEQGNKFIVRFSNSGRADLRKIEKILLWFVPLRKNATVDERFSWVVSEHANSIKVGAPNPSFDFTISEPLALKVGLPKGEPLQNETILGGIVILSKQLPHSYFSDAWYTWDSGKNWARLEGNQGNLDINHRKNMNAFFESLNTCLSKHKKNYSACFPEN